ncbi:MAG: phosphonate C-P lyase system protein PhnH, partial [Paracoccaceae bacterium]
ALRDWVRFHCGAPLVTAQQARFALGGWDELAPLSRFASGTMEYPDRSATLIVEMPALEPRGITLRGPGIRDSAALSLPEAEAFRDNAARFPLGLDFFFTCGDRLAALPRSTRIG